MLAIVVNGQLLLGPHKAGISLELDKGVIDRFVNWVSTYIFVLCFTIAGVYTWNTLAHTTADTMF